MHKYAVVDSGIVGFQNMRPQGSGLCLKTLEDLDSIELYDAQMLERVKLVAKSVFEGYQAKYCWIVRVFLWAISCIYESSYSKAWRLFEKIKAKELIPLPEKNIGLDSGLTEQYRRLTKTHRQIEGRVTALKMEMDSPKIWQDKQFRARFNQLFNEAYNETMGILDTLDEYPLTERVQLMNEQKRHNNLYNFCYGFFFNGACELYQLARNGSYRPGYSWTTGEVDVKPFYSDGTMESHWRLHYNAIVDRLREIAGDGLDSRYLEWCPEDRARETTVNFGRMPSFFPLQPEGGL